MKKTESNIGSILNEEIYSPVTEHLVTDKDILIFSKQILFFLFIAFVLCGIGGVIFKSQVLFEIMKTEISSAFMLIVGYYLGDKRR